MRSGNIRHAIGSNRRDYVCLSCRIQKKGRLPKPRSTDSTSQGSAPYTILHPWASSSTFTLPLVPRPSQGITPGVTSPSQRDGRCGQPPTFPAQHNWSAERSPRLGGSSPVKAYHHCFGQQSRPISRRAIHTGASQWNGRPSRSSSHQRAYRARNLFNSIYKSQQAVFQSTFAALAQDISSSSSHSAASNAKEPLPKHPKTQGDDLKNRYQKLVQDISSSGDALSSTDKNKSELKFDQLVKLKSKKTVSDSDSANKVESKKKKKKSTSKTQTRNVSADIKRKIEKLRARLDDAAAKDAASRELASVGAHGAQVGKQKKNSKGQVLVRRKRSSSSKTGTTAAHGTEIEVISASDLAITPLEIEQPPVPRLAYNLERVLFNPGVYHLQDPRSRVYNFDQYLEKIMPVEEFDFNSLKQYVTSSKDTKLLDIGKAHGKRYVGSTSSMTSVLSHFHFLLSQWRPINVSMLSKSFPDRKLLNFTEIQRIPSSIFLRFKDGAYAIDADKEFDSANVLSMLGKSMEKLLTLDTEEFERYRKSNPEKVSEDERSTPESYHYSTLGDFLMRSQLDAHDSRLPGTGMFDLKTRAVISIRMDVKDYEQATGYQIKSRTGEYESFEREYFDMIRAAFLKYSMQVRMGRMDGIFVAFHNIERIFGFQYVSLPEMDATIHGQSDTSIGDQEFVLSLSLLNRILNKATEKFPNTSIRIHFETRDASTPFMYIFAEPVTEERIAEIQTQNASEIEEFERRVLGLSKEADAESEGKDGAPWKNIQANVQDAMNKDELSLDEADRQAEESKAQEGMPPHTCDDVSENESDVSGAIVQAGDDTEQEEEEDGDEDEDEADEHEDMDEDQEDEEDPDEEDEEDEDDNGEDDDNGSRENDEGAIKAQDDKDVDKDIKDAKVEELEHGKEIAVEQPLGSTDASSEQSLQQNKETEQMTPKDTKKDEFPIEADTSFLEALATEEHISDPLGEILAMTLTVRNRVNGYNVPRPEQLTTQDDWSVEFSLEEVPSQARAQKLYESCKKRRKAKLGDDETSTTGEEKVLNHYIQHLRELSLKGREWREKMDQMERGKPTKVVWQGDSPHS